MRALAVLALAVGLVYLAVGTWLDAQRLLYAGVGATYIAVVWLIVAVVHVAYRDGRDG